MEEKCYKTVNARMFEGNCKAALTFFCVCLQAYTIEGIKRLANKKIITPQGFSSMLIKFYPLAQVCSRKQSVSIHTAL